MPGPGFSRAVDHSAPVLGPASPEVNLAPVDMPADAVIVAEAGDPMRPLLPFMQMPEGRGTMATYRPY